MRATKNTINQAKKPESRQNPQARRVLNNSFASNKKEDAKRISRSSSFSELKEAERNEEEDKEKPVHQCRKPRTEPIPIFIVHCRMRFKDVPVSDCFTGRKYFDVTRWQCIPRPQYNKSCSITCIVGCWNFMFSTMGKGSLAPITPVAAMKILGFPQKITEVPFLEIAGNSTLKKWFERLCAHFKVRGLARTFWKRDTTTASPDELLRSYIVSIRRQNRAFIYHCRGHYCTPVGFELASLDASKAYSSKLRMEGFEPWVFLGESTRWCPGIHVVRWEAIGSDIMCDDQHYYEIKRPDKGPMLKQLPAPNAHCLIEFRTF